MAYYVLVAGIDPGWPKFSLDQCQHLVNEAAVIEGLSSDDGWSRALSIWDPTLEGWCTLSIDVLSRFPSAPRQILVRRAQLKDEDCHRFYHFLKSTYDTDTATSFATVGTTGPPMAAAGPLALKGTLASSPISGLVKDDDEIIVVGEVGPSSTAEQLPAKTTPNHMNDEAVQSHLLEWLQLLKTVPRLRAWDRMFAARFKRGDRTVYRHAKWLDALGEDRLREWEQLQISHSKPVTIGALRQSFHKEYLAASKQPQPDPTVKKRKLGEQRSKWIIKLSLCNIRLCHCDTINRKSGLVQVQSSSKKMIFTGKYTLECQRFREGNYDHKSLYPWGLTTSRTNGAMKQARGATLSNLYQHPFFTSHSHALKYQSTSLCQLRFSPHHPSSYFSFIHVVERNHFFQLLWIQLKKSPPHQRPHSPLPHRPRLTHLSKTQTNKAPPLPNRLVNPQPSPCTMFADLTPQAFLRLAVPTIRTSLVNGVFPSWYHPTLP
ncbi:uncharacterized protein MELLADRAFT_95918 [Melampsora larici-populina 98AG31]|uniref:Uncharacterized protein n=1 Tax=Melampsora larici-populina (strain 98AG31 / pathotype 3-4-7) TaxID=747676 RepID=F4RDR1_MELLP|nr:uncharacterized protein MELLADRAFT_95918 [Melampsora larici-populina 98AG31]EGG09563.1 hypothetical protein MELLADRAFT_95918 [Melampsora larici-populina 98AG31]